MVNIRAINILILVAATVLPCLGILITVGIVAIVVGFIQNRKDEE